MSPSSAFFLLAAAGPAAGNGTATAPLTGNGTAGAAYLPAPEYVLDKTGDVLGALAILLVGFWLVGKSTGGLRKLLTRRQIDRTLSVFLCSMAYWLLLIFVIMASLEKVGVTTTSAVAVLGAGTLAIGLAMQNSLSNIAASVMIILFRHFRVGDYIEAGGVAGEVQEITIFDTHLRTPDNRKVIVPNGQIIGGAIVNYNAYETRRLDLTLSIAYSADMEQAKTLAAAVLDAEPLVLREPAPLIAVGKVGGGAVDVWIRPWVRVGDYNTAQSRLLEALKKRCDAAGLPRT
jgi:small conductance mechanosensitive channel